MCLSASACEGADESDRHVLFSVKGICFFRVLCVEQKWASNEQSGMQKASNDTAAAMTQGNQDYQAKMGFR